MEKNIKVALCCIGKMENNYIHEYVEYYYELGFDKIFLYDNNDIDGEHFEDVIQDYIDKEFVEIINYRNEKVCQLKAYQDCYDKHNEEYDWIAFFDCDEFLTLTEDNNIKNFLSKQIYDNYDCICINWKMYGDNNLIGNETNNFNCLDRFTKPLPDGIMGYDFFYHGPENNHVKSIVRCKNKNISWVSTPHTPFCQGKTCNNLGKEIPNMTPFSDYNFTNAYIKHFATKTILEYKQKIKRGYCDQSVELSRQHLSFNRFFKINYITDKKLQIINDTVE